MLLGNRGAAFEALANTALADREYRATAFPLVLQGMPLEASHGVLQALASRQNQQRWVIQGSGVVGDPAYVPWLIRRMEHPPDARLARRGLHACHRSRHHGTESGDDGAGGLRSGPNEIPDDPNVEMDPDDGLPWPDAKRSSMVGGQRDSIPRGQRYFMGAPVTREHCIDVLKNGYQRQRILAAHYLCLLDPGTPLFNTSAPAWRQQRLLAQMK